MSADSKTQDRALSRVTDSIVDISCVVGLLGEHCEASNAPGVAVACGWIGERLQRVIDELEALEDGSRAGLAARRGRLLRLVDGVDNEEMEE